MKILSKFTFRYLKLNKKRTIVTIIGVILSSALLFGVALTFSTIKESMYRTAIEKSGSQHVRFQDIPFEKYELLKNDKTIANITYTVPVGEVGYDKLFVNIISANIDYQQYFELVGGHFPTSKNEVIVSNDFTNYGNKTIGETITDANNVTYKIVGVYNYSRFYYYRYQKWVAQENDYIYSYHEDKPYQTATFLVMYKSLDNIYDQIIETAKKLDLKFQLNYQRVQYEKTDVNYELLNIISEVSDYYSKAFLMIATLIIMSVISIVTIFIIYNSFSISVTERKKMMGILASIGATPRQRLISVFLEGALIALIGIPPGFLLSFGIVGLIVFVVNNVLGGIAVLPTYIALDPAFFGMALVALILVILFSALSPAKRASEVTPLEAIRASNDIKIKAKKLKSGKLTRKLFGIEAELATKSMKRSKKKFRITVFTLTLSIVLFLTAATYVNIIQYGLTAYDGAKPPFDFMLSIENSPEGKEALETIGKSDIYCNQEKYRKMHIRALALPLEFYTKEALDADFPGVKLEYKKNASFYTVIGLDNDEYQTLLNENNLTEPRPILVNRIKHIRYDQTGNMITEMLTVYKESFTINLTENEIVEKPFNISNIYLSDKASIINDQLFINRAVIYVNEEMYESYLENFTKNVKTYSSMYHFNGNFKNNLAKDYEKMDGILKSYPGMSYDLVSQAFERYATSRYLLAGQIVSYSIIGFITLISLTSVINTVNTNMRLRRREFAMLRSIGLSNRNFNKMIFYESLMIGFKSLVYGLLLSVIVIYFSLEALQIKEVAFKVDPPYWAIITAIIGVMSIVLITMLYSIKKIKNDNIVETIRTENI